jgi:diguanylate cyclase (GGDEF)-like protein
MTTVFFAAVFPLRDQVALFGISLLSYVAVLVIYGEHVDASTLMLRLGSLAMLAFLGGFLAAELRRQMSTHRHLALHDPLTGLANRTLFYDRVEQAIALARRDGKCAGILVFDLDRFKEVNDTLGHSAGDALLVQIASRLSDKVIRRSDTIARMGGDEFAVVAPNIAAAAAVQQPARRILHALETPFMIAGAEVRVGASVGFAIFPEDGEEVETLIEAADRRMYLSKSSSQPKPQASRLAPAQAL